MIINYIKDRKTIVPNLRIYTFIGLKQSLLQFSENIQIIKREGITEINEIDDRLYSKNQRCQAKNRS